MGRQTIEERRGEFLVARKHGDPLGKGDVGRDDRGPALVAIRNQIEEQLAADAVEGHEAELIDDQHSTRSRRCWSRVSSRLSRASSSWRTTSAARVKSTPLLLRRLHAQRDGQVRLAGTDRTVEDQFLGRYASAPPGETENTSVTNHVVRIASAIATGVTLS